MTPSFAVFTFFNTWWVMLFFVLPFFARPNQAPSQLQYAAAPETPRWKKVVLVNSLVSLAVTLLLALIINSGLFHASDI